MVYKDCVGVVEIDTEDRMLYGKVIGLRDVIGFEGATFEELEASFHRAVDCYLEVCAEKGKTPNKPYSGKVLLRTDPDTHRDIAQAAAAASMSMNQWVEKTLKEQTRSTMWGQPSCSFTPTPLLKLVQSGSPPCRTLPLNSRFRRSSSRPEAG